MPVMDSVVGNKAKQEKKISIKKSLQTRTALHFSNKMQIAGNSKNCNGIGIKTIAAAAAAATMNEAKLRDYDRLQELFVTLGVIAALAVFYCCCCKAQMYCSTCVAISSSTMQCSGAVAISTFSIAVVSKSGLGLCGQIAHLTEFKTATK